MTRRRQATLYLPLPNSDRVESLRSQFNRDQFELIRAHVTLCREDEVSDWGELASRLLDLGRIEVELEHETVQLALGKRIYPVEFHRVLSGNEKKWLRKCISFPIDRYRAFFHGF